MSSPDTRSPRSFSPFSACVIAVRSGAIVSLTVSGVPKPGKKLRAEKKHADDCRRETSSSHASSNQRLFLILEIPAFCTQATGRPQVNVAAYRKTDTALETYHLLVLVLVFGFAAATAQRLGIISVPPPAIVELIETPPALQPAPAPANTWSGRFGQGCRYIGAGGRRDGKGSNVLAGLRRGRLRGAGYQLPGVHSRHALGLFLMEAAQGGGDHARILGGLDGGQAAY